MKKCPSCGSRNYVENELNKEMFDHILCKCNSCGWAQISIKFNPSNDMLSRPGTGVSMVQTCSGSALV